MDCQHESKKKVFCSTNPARSGLDKKRNKRRISEKHNNATFAAIYVRYKNPHFLYNLLSSSPTFVNTDFQGSPQLALLSSTRLA